MLNVIEDRRKHIFIESYEVIADFYPCQLIKKYCTHGDTYQQWLLILINIPIGKTTSVKNVQISY